MNRVKKCLIVEFALLFVLSVSAASTRIAIGTLGLKPERRDSDLADLTAAHLSASPNFELVERRELDAALKEVSLSVSGIVRAKDAVRIGTLLRAEKFLLGSSVPVNGTNHLVIRLVNARNGVIEAINVIVDTGSLDVMAGKIADFVRTENGQATPESRNYLAIGVIQNLGVNNRFPDFPAQMRGNVTAKLSGKVTVLERDVVSFLANEVRLDMAGLTQADGKPAAKMQFGFWIVDGFYQSYEVASPEVQLKLRVEHVQGGQQSFDLQGKPDEPFFTEICDTIKGAMDGAAETSKATPVANDEIKALEKRGEQLVEYQSPRMYMRAGSIRIKDRQNPDKASSALDEAVRVYESILLLDPENNAAKLRLAGCLLFDTAYWIEGRTNSDQAQRIARAHEYYREVIALGNPHEANDARIDLARSIVGVPGLKLLRQFKSQIIDPAERERAAGVWGEMYWETLAHFPVKTVQPEIHAYMLEQLVAARDNPVSVPKVDFGGNKGALHFYRYQREVREQIINQYLPEFLKEFPELSPYIQLAAASEQVTTNSPVVAQFLETLKKCEDHPESVWHPDNFFTHLSSTRAEEIEEGAGRQDDSIAYMRAFGNQQFELVVALAIARQRANQRGLAPPLTDWAQTIFAKSYVALGRWKEALELYERLPNIETQVKNECRSHLGIALESEALPDSAWITQSDIGKVEIAYQCMDRKQWATAVKILESIGRRTVDMRKRGPWGYAFAPVLPAVVADECRVKSGLPAVRDPIRFELGDRPYISFLRDGYRKFSIELEGEDVWMATYSEIKRFHGTGPFTAAEPKELYPFERIKQSATTSICVSRDYIWVGTYDDGLTELDRRTGACRRFTIKDGLPLDGISGLKLQGRTLWISYRNGANGVVGTLDIASHKFSTLTPNLPSDAGTNSPSLWSKPNDDPHQPPILPVSAMTEAQPGEMWFAIRGKGIQRFQLSGGKWDTFWQNTAEFRNFRDMAVDRTRGLLFFALGRWNVYSGGLVIFDYLHDQPEHLSMEFVDGLPSDHITAVAVEGPTAWVGGKGFVAVIDIPTRKVLKIAYVSAAEIRQIRLTSEHAWVAFSCGGGDAYPEFSGNAWTGVYRLDRAAIEPKVQTVSLK